MPVQVSCGPEKVNHLPAGLVTLAPGALHAEVLWQLVSSDAPLSANLVSELRRRGLFGLYDTARLLNRLAG